MREHRSKFPPASEIKKTITRFLTDTGNDCSMNEVREHLEMVFAGRLTPDLLALRENTRPTASYWYRVVRSAKDELVKSGVLRPLDEVGRDIFSLAHCAKGQPTYFAGESSAQELNDTEDFRNSADPVETSHGRCEVADIQEGTEFELTLTAYERNPKARAACIRHYGAACQICGFDFERKYGFIGRGFIHVHHRTPLAIVAGNHTVDPIRDLVPVCPNCHSMLHIGKRMLRVEALKSKLENGHFSTSD